MGGLSKKGYQIITLKQKKELPALTLDAGGLLFKREQLAPGRQDIEKITARAIIDSYNAMGYDAVGIGPQDLAAGLKFLQVIRKRAKFPLLSANIVHKSNRLPIFTPFTTFAVGNLKVGIIGLTGTVSATPFAHSDDAVILSWQEILPAHLANLENTCDLIIVLSSLPAQENKRIADTYPVHLIVQSGPRSSNIDPAPTNNALICQTGSQGKYLGWLQITWGGSKHWAANETSSLITMKQEIDRINHQLRMHPENLALAVRQKQLTSRLQQMEQEQAAAKQPDGEPATFQNGFIPMDVSLPDQPEVLKIVREMKKEINEFGRKTAQQAPQQSSTGTNAPGGKADAQSIGPYIGWSACAQCHAGQVATWKKSPHARAYQTLVNQKQNFNRQCISCHVTGIKSGAERTALSLPRALRQVGCEACHGPGRKHSEAPTANHLTSMPSESTCRGCHSNERDSTFNYLNDIKRLNCPPV